MIHAYLEYLDLDSRQYRSLARVHFPGDQFLVAEVAFAGRHREVRQDNGFLMEVSTPTNIAWRKIIRKKRVSRPFNLSAFNLEDVQRRYRQITGREETVLAATIAAMRSLAVGNLPRLVVWLEGEGGRIAA